MKVLKLFFKLTIIFIIFFEAVVSLPKWGTTKKGLKYLIEPSAEFNWFEAVNECARRELHLVYIESEEKNKDLTELIKKQYGKSLDLWIGANDEFDRDAKEKDLNRPFYWSVLGERMNYTYWAAGNPDNANGNEHCIHIWRLNDNFQWNDNVCDTKQAGFICSEHTLDTKTCRRIVNSIVYSPCNTAETKHKL